MWITYILKPIGVCGNLRARHVMLRNSTTAIDFSQVLDKVRQNKKKIGVQYYILNKYEERQLYHRMY